MEICKSNTIARAWFKATGIVGSKWFHNYKYNDPDHRQGRQFVDQPEESRGMRDLSGSEDAVPGVEGEMKHRQQQNEAEFGPNPALVKIDDPGSCQQQQPE